jgi:hypothetical protein
MSDHGYPVVMYPTITVARVCTFTSHVLRGQTYRHEILPDLFFCLIPSGIFSSPSDEAWSEGWSIIITDPQGSACDGSDWANFGPIVTPPMRGNLTFDVHGWQFRNKENTGPNDGSLNVPQENRSFYFLFNRRDFEAVWHAERCAQWAIPEDCALATQNPAGRDVFIPRSWAYFTATKLELGNLVAGSKAWIEYMEFTVDIYLPVEQ